MRQLRRNVPTRLAAWRADVERNSGKRSVDEWREDLYRALSTASPLLCAALVAVESNREAVSNQTGILDDFFQVPNWNQGGYRRVVETPLLIGHFLHHVMGALFINGREHRRAITLLCSTVQADTRLEPGPLWRSHELMFAAEAVTDSVTEMWRFLLGLYPKLTWLSHFFVNDREYIEGIRAYRAVASLIELGKELASGRDLRTSKTVFPSVAPVFLTNPRGLREPSNAASLISKAVPTTEVLNDICKATGCDPDQIYKAWPEWFGVLVRAYSELYSNTVAGRFAGSQRAAAPSLPR